MSEEKTNEGNSNFIRNIIDEDLAAGKHKGVVTRFPPEPNGYLHIGHAKSICLNFGLANIYDNSKCHLRFDDTNPEKEDVEYVDSIKEDVKWLGFDWGENLYHASDYFDQLHQFAIDLIKMGKAFVCDLNAEQMREYRGSLKEPGKNSPFRDRSVEENLELFEKMKNGEFDEGQCTLRAKIDMTSPNVTMRDPVIYRIRKVEHQRTGDKWQIYPMYDFTHCLSDDQEHITHSICTLEFEDRRPLYDWVLDTLGRKPRPYQYEFARLNLNYLVMSKRKLLQLVENKNVSGWDDPRMPTISGMRRRGFTPESIRNFCDYIGVGKKNTVISMSILEDHLRKDLETKAPRVMGVLDPIKVTITNYPEDKEEILSCPFHPKDESFGRRDVPFSGEVYVERSDYMDDAPKKFFRLSQGREVRLRYGYVIKCNEVIKDDKGNVVELKCTYDPETLGGKTPDGRKVKGIIHWVSAKHAIACETRIYDRLFSHAKPTGDDWLEHLNKDSLSINSTSYVEPSLKDAKKGEHWQFERMGYFCLDSVDSNDSKFVFNRAVSLRDSWAKIEKEQTSS